jgi:hypothetical protein
VATFRGILSIEGEPNSELTADVNVADGRLTIRVRGVEIGDWALNDVTIEQAGEAFRVLAEDGALLLRFNDQKRFAGHVGLRVAAAYDVPAPAETARPPVPPPPSPMPAPEAPPERRTSPVPGPDESPLARALSWALVGTAGIFFLGALLDWGPVRLTNSNFPLGRLLVVLAGFAAFAAAYLGLALEKRRDVALVAMMSGLIAVLVVIFYARRAGIGYGFIVTIFGAVAVISISVLALSRLGAPTGEDGG